MMRRSGSGGLYLGLQGRHTLLMVNPGGGPASRFQHLPRDLAGLGAKPQDTSGFQRERHYDKLEPSLSKRYLHGTDRIIKSRLINCATAGFRTWAGDLAMRPVNLRPLKDRDATGRNVSMGRGPVVICANHTGPGTGNSRFDGNSS